MAFTTRLLSDETGTAFADTLVALPVLGLILAGVLALNAAYGAKLEAKSRARAPLARAMGGAVRRSSPR